MEDERPFLIPVKRRWTLLILPVLALVYFAFVVWLGATRTTVRGVPMDYLVLGGLAFFLLVAVVELPFFLRRRPPKAAPPPERAEWQDEPPEPVAAPARDDERLTTDETQQGMRVLEYSAPAKSRNRGAVYAKTYVPVTKEHVLRVETLAAEPAEL
ncbi:MAG TPA: hypothetical protein VNX21_03820 [Candidatus Thermoplasmatota archaeon]|nr:hypothetical protein [Candidatus Thermoplasmatota archaeon]